MHFVYMCNYKAIHAHWYVLLHVWVQRRCNHVGKCKHTWQVVKYLMQTIYADIREAEGVAAHEVCNEATLLRDTFICCAC